MAQLIPDGKTLPLVSHAGGTYSMKSKIITLAEEFRRILLHMDDIHMDEEKEKVIANFLQKMVDS